MHHVGGTTENSQLPPLGIVQGANSESEKLDYEKSHIENNAVKDEGTLSNDDNTGRVTWTKTQIGAVMSLSALWVGKHPTRGSDLILRLLTDHIKVLKFLYTL